MHTALIGAGAFSEKLPAARSKIDDVEAAAIVHASVAEVMDCPRILGDREQKLRR